MLLPDNVFPEYSIYYNGYLILKELKRLNNQDFFTLYINLNNEKDISFSTYMLCLDWLYLMEMAIVDDEGVVKICF